MGNPSLTTKVPTHSGASMPHWMMQSNSVSGMEGAFPVSSLTLKNLKAHPVLPQKDWPCLSYTWGTFLPDSLVQKMYSMDMFLPFVLHSFPVLC